MTLLIASIFGHSEVELREAIGSAIEQGADAVELRLDLCDGVTDEEVRRIRESGALTVPLILTIRSAGEGGAWEGDDTDRVSRLIELGPIADYIDVELALWNRSANIRQKIGLALARAGHITQAGGKEEIEHAVRRRLILSRHDTTTRPANLHSDLVDMLSARECDAPKLAWRARTVRDNFEAFDLMRESPKPPIVICMGDVGIASRVLSKKFGALGTFASLTTDTTTAAGQATVAQMRTLYRWEQITPRTRIYGVIGDPVAQSLSPLVHNAAFTQTGVDGVYLPFRVAPGYESFKAFMVEVIARPWLDLGGFSVTIPHKENALRFLVERGDEIESTARSAGVVNTIVFRNDGRIAGHNTDLPAIIESACRLLDCTKEQLAGKRITILGAGGVARAAVAAFMENNADITVLNRTQDRARSLAEDLRCRIEPWSRRDEVSGDLLVNCTSCGMAPQDDQSPMPAGRLANHGAVLDTIYRPDPTKLVREARAAGIPADVGLGLFISQATGQFRIWTGRDAPEGLMLAAAANALKTAATGH
ncbi:MAG: type I 3-dehydroquinate dehydratase [Planctomycetes bacterium]|nr:type I 3-dehydroquinate dehydratase [Planctomycetota bacterium]